MRPPRSDLRLSYCELRMARGGVIGGQGGWRTKSRPGSSSATRGVGHRRARSGQTSVCTPMNRLHVHGANRLASDSTHAGGEAERVATPRSRTGEALADTACPEQSTIQLRGGSSKTRCSHGSVLLRCPAATNLIAEELAASPTHGQPTQQYASARDADFPCSSRPVRRTRPRRG